MGYLIAVDQSLSMGGTIDGRVRKKINGILEKSRFEIAADIVEALLHCAGRLNVEPVVHLYRIGESFLNLGEVSSVEDVVTMITKDDGQDVELFGCTSMSRFMAFTHDNLNPTVDDKIIVLTDCSHFKYLDQGDFNYGISCETRFIIVNTNKKSMSPMQLEELDEIAASSIGYEVSPKNESMYHHFFVGDFPSIHELSTSVFDEMFEMSAYTLQMGHMTTQIKIGHTFVSPGIDKINIIGFVRPPALMNMEVTGTHYVHPVFYDNPAQEADTTVSTPVVANTPEEAYDSDEDPVIVSSSSSSESDEELTEIEEEVSDHDEEDAARRAREGPRMSFIPTKALLATDISAHISKSNPDDDINLPDFVPPTKPVVAPAPPPPAAPVEPAAPAAPKRKYKVISRSSGVEKEYIPGQTSAAAAAAAAAAPVDIPSPAFEPLEDAKISPGTDKKRGDEKRRSDEKKGDAPPPPKKTKIIIRTVPKNKKDPKKELLKKKRAAFLKKLKIDAAISKREVDKIDREVRRQNGIKEPEEGEEPEKKAREEYNRDDVVLSIVVKSDDEYSEGPWSPVDGEFSDLTMYEKMKNELKEEEEKKDEDGKVKVEEVEEVKEEEKKTDGEEKKKDEEENKKDDQEKEIKKEEQEKEGDEKKKDEEVKEIKKEEKEKEGDEKTENGVEKKKEGAEKVETAEKKDEKKEEEKKTVESTDVEMKEEKVGGAEDQKKDEEKEIEKVDDDDDEEGVVKVIPTPFRPSRSKRTTRVIPGFTAPYLAQMLAEAMRLEELFAVCLLDNGEYGVLSYDQNSEGDDLLSFSTIVDQDMMPTIIPHFSQLLSHFDDTNEVDNFFISQQVGENPSYILARSNWTSEEGIEADMVRIRKNLKKAPERISHFYVDVNRMRAHAYCVCMESRLGLVADMIVAEAKDFGAVAVKHAEYVATHYRKKVKKIDLKDIPIPDF